jgi:hypothetical protein
VRDIVRWLWLWLLRLLLFLAVFRLDFRDFFEDLRDLCEVLGVLKPTLAPTFESHSLAHPHPPRNFVCPLLEFRRIFLIIFTKFVIKILFYNYRRLFNN